MNNIVNGLKIVVIMLLLTGCSSQKTSLLVECESFADLGGWVMDNQSVDQMGSPYLMAHGMGIPVEDAQTTISIKEDGDYYIWVRTRDWIKQWDLDGSPGKFQIKVNDKTLETIYGTESREWSWQKGDKVALKKGANSIKLHDLTGFNGRCDAIYFTTDKNDTPINSAKELAQLRREMLNIADPESVGDYDLVVVGGGITGISSAVAAARLGCKVALIHNRPVLGGNNSSEVRVGLSGFIMQKPYVNLGHTVEDLGIIGYWNEVEARQEPNTKRSQDILNVLKENPEKLIHNAGPKSNYEDQKKENLVRSEKNISLFMNTHAFDVVMDGDKISAVIARNNLTGKESMYRGKMFVDCTGDGNLGYLAGADFRVGRESRAETSEERAPIVADTMVMGTSVQWYSKALNKESSFPDCSWGLKFNEETCQKLTRGDWTWETGLNKNQVTQIEEIRDYGLRAVYGNWSYLKNHYSKKEQFAKEKLEWVAYIGGKRESRRLLGDIILQEQDLTEQKEYDDASFTTTWGIDLHYPDPVKGMEGDPFLTYCDVKEIKPYAVPYRCLYSRNVDNLFMAGRNISVTHVALGTIRVMRTTGMMGEVVGMAAAICKRHNSLPRSVYESHLDELKEMMTKGVSKQ